LRLGWTIINPKPALPSDTPCWQRGAERLVHFLLYAAVIGMPLAGWIGSVAAKRPPHLGNINFNLPIEPDKALSGIAFEIHGYLAVAIVVLVTIHFLAAFYHQYIKHDNILRRMLPS